ncbi:MAG: glycosyltransferase family 61 protein [Gemmatimonadaceae bacterium]
MLALHVRHAHLLREGEEPSRLQLTSQGVLDPTPMVMAPEYLRRARALARTASVRESSNAVVQLTLAECELSAGNAGAARRAAERSATLSPPDMRGAALATQALASFADHHEARAIDLLRSPHVTELASWLGTGRLISASIDPSLAPCTALTDPNRVTVRIPCRVQLNRVTRNRTVTVRVAAPEQRVLDGARVVGGEWIVLDADDRAFVHGVSDATTSHIRGSEFATALGGAERNRILWSGDDRLLLHAPRIDREHSGRAVLLATGTRANFSRWLLEAIGRLSEVPEMLLEPDIRFVVPSQLSPMQRERLSWLGIGDDRLATVDDDEIVSFEELVLVRHRTHGGCVDAQVISWLRDKLTVPDIVTSAPPTRRLFLRSTTSEVTRLLVNELELERLCRVHGFEAVDVDALSLAQCRDLFADAACIVSAEQPLLANLLFAPRGTEVVILAPRSFARPRHAALAHSLGQSVTFVLGAERPTRAAYPNWEFAVDPENVQVALARAAG